MTEQVIQKIETKVETKIVESKILQQNTETIIKPVYHYKYVTKIDERRLRRLE